uniref:NADH-ubiquinone oxidoreductase chain 6 n=1 Tax=Allopsontus sp. 2 JZ-2014 TaxID=1529457 RepID=A0A0B4N5Y7_9INSE|nr:NADH dehydrogenase subunit 6 [Allopsontus sp. 2 JZ-2014]
MYVLFSMIFLTNLIMISLKHPVAMGLMLMIQTIMISLLLGKMYLSFWFSYILVLIFLGGLLVLFLYVASLASNELFSIKIKINLIVTFLLLTTIFMFMNNLPTPVKMSEGACPLTYSPDSMLLNTLSKFYTLTVSPLTIALISYLLLTLIAVVKITKKDLGPLRKLH